MRPSFVLLIFLLLGLPFSVFSQNVGINDDNSDPDPSAMLDVKSQTKGMLVPRMTTTQRTSIASPATGLLVYDNTTTSFWFYNGTKWVELLSGTVTDVDTLTLTGNILSISSGNTVDLSSFLDNTDKQTLTLSNDSLSISGGNKIDLSSINTDSQTLTFNNDSLSISGGNKVDLSSINTDKQTLTLTGDSLFISGGNKISLAVFANDTLPLIQDADRNTKVLVEKNANEDIVRFEMGGIEYFNMTKGGRLNVGNSGESVFIGEDAGKNDDLTTNKNVAIGYQAFTNNITGVGNVGIGYEALKNTTANSNTAVGYQSMPSNTTGTWNSAFGQNSLLNNTTGNNNLALGGQALVSNISGSNNVAIGMNAYGNHSTGDNNVVIGYNAGSSNTNGASNIFLGYSSGSNETGSNKLYIENSNSATPLIYGNFANDSVKIYGTLNIQNKYSFPNVDGTSNQLMMTNGAGVLSWISPSLLSITETDPKVGTLTSDYLPKWGTTTLTNSQVYDNGTNVGIGTTSPSEKLNVSGRILASNPGSSPNGSQIILGSPANDVGVTIYRGDGSGGTTQRWDMKVTSDDALRFRSNNSSDLMAITNTGNVGIGTNTPTEALYIERTSDDAIIHLNANSSTYESRIEFQKFGSYSAGVGYYPGNANLRLRTVSNSVIVFEPNSTETMRIDTNGYVGINTTSPKDRLHVVGNIRMVDGNEGAGKIMVSDANGTASWASTSTLDDQTLSLDNTIASLSITNGNSVILSTLADADGNTKIQVEKNANEDKIRFDLGGTEIFRFEPTRIQISSISNVFIGDLVGSANTTGSDNVGIGKYSLASNTTGYSNISLGTNSLNNNTTGFRNVSIGAGALQQNLIGNNNTAIGYTALNNNTGDDNTALGQEAMISNVSGIGNVSIGKSTLFSNTTGNNNTVVGLYAGYYNTGSSNVFLGNRAGQNETGSDKLYIENSASSTPLIYGNFADDSVKINGNFQVGTNGDATVAVANAWNTFSDRRYKTDFKVIENALAKIDAIHGYYYKWKDKPDTTTQVGVIAQEIEAVLPQVVATNAEGYKSVDYSKLTALLIEALKEQQAIIENQEKSISDLKDDMAMIKQYLQLNTEAKK